MGPGRPRGGSWQLEVGPASRVPTSPPRSAVWRATLWLTVCAGRATLTWGRTDGCATFRCDRPARPIYNRVDLPIQYVYFPESAVLSIGWRDARRKRRRDGIRRVGGHGRPAGLPRSRERASAGGLSDSREALRLDTGTLQREVAAKRRASHDPQSLHPGLLQEVAQAGLQSTSLDEAALRALAASHPRPRPAGTSFPLTQRFLSQMLGVPRATAGKPRGGSRGPASSPTCTAASWYAIVRGSSATHASVTRSCGVSSTVFSKDASREPSRGREGVGRAGSSHIRAHERTQAYGTGTASRAPNDVDHRSQTCQPPSTPSPPKTPSRQQQQRQRTHGIATE
jgi:hypothetical protein